PGPAILGILGTAVIAGLMLSVGVAPAVALTGMGTKSGIGLFNSLPDDYKIADDLQQKTEIYAKRGDKDVLLASFYNQNREVVKWDDIPDTVKHATLAAEDARYYQHGGVDPMGILRAIASNVMHGSGQGASTITQQYVKNVCVQEAELLSTQAKVDAAYAECTGGLKRKLREARLAIGLEKAYKKDDILLGYLNIAGFGGRIYGIESAAQYYYADDHRLRAGEVRRVLLRLRRQRDQERQGVRRDRGRPLQQAAELGLEDLHDAGPRPAEVRQGRDDRVRALRLRLRHEPGRRGRVRAGRHRPDPLDGAEQALRRHRRQGHQGRRIHRDRGELEHRHRGRGVSGALGA
ncbi:MAG: hypothetical protein EOO66_33815, partial [Methylobacterium sp.]